MELGATLLRFLQYTTELAVLCWDEQRRSLEAFEHVHCFLSGIQPFFMAENLELVLKHMQRGYLYEVKDLLGMRLLLFEFDQKKYIAGPFVVEEWKEIEGEKKLAELRVAASFLLPYKMYYCSYRLLDEQVAERLVMGAITALKPEEPPYLRQMLTGQHDRMGRELHEHELPDFDMVMRRYEIENKFLKHIKNGNSHAALEAYVQMGKFSISDPNFSAGNMQAMIANATVVRTLVRKAAEQGGLHPAVVDSISVAYTQKMYASVSVRELVILIEQMVQEFGDAVCRMRQERYSSDIHRVVSYISVHLSEEIRMEKLAEVAEMTSAHLSRRFKEETGDTVSRYVAGKRCKKAAELLRSTNLPIQDISAHVGYLDNNYFVKVFKSCYGMTPSGYRSRLGYD